MKISLFVKQLREAGWKLETIYQKDKSGYASFVSAAGFLQLDVETNWTGRIKKLTFHEDALTLVVEFYISSGNTQHYPITAYMQHHLGNKSVTLDINKKTIFAEFKDFILDDGSLSYLRLKYANN